MPRGRRPDAPGVQDAKGNPRKQAKSKRAAVLDAVPSGLKPPKRLHLNAQAVWKELAPELERTRFLRKTDVNAFARYCDALERWWEVSEQLRNEGQTYTSKSAHGDLKRVNPLFLIEERLVRRCTELEDRFGLNPMARQQMLLRLAQTSTQLPFETSQQPQAEMPVVSPVGLLSQPTRH